MHLMAGNVFLNAVLSKDGGIFTWLAQHSSTGRDGIPVASWTDLGYWIHFEVCTENMHPGGCFQKTTYCVWVNVFSCLNVSFQKLCAKSRWGGMMRSISVMVQWKWTFALAVGEAENKKQKHRRVMFSCFCKLGNNRDLIKCPLPSQQLKGAGSRNSRSSMPERWIWLSAARGIH